MKQKSFFSFATAMLVAGACFVSCSISDNPVGSGLEPEPEPQPVLPVAPYEFDKGSLIVNGQFDGAEAENYWCHEWRTSDAQFDGIANIVADPADPTNRCAAVVVRSEEEAKAAGNMIEANGAIAGWDSQFFITFPEELALKEKDQIRLTMKVKADAAQVADTQSHLAPGAYIHWYCIGDVNFTTEWTEFDSGFVTVSSGGEWGKAQAGMYTIAFNLSRGIHNTVYFDDIRVEVVRYDPFDEGNIVKNGTFNSDNVTNYTCHEWRTMEAQFDGGANIVADPADATNRCAAVVVRSEEEAKAAGNMIEADGKIAGWDSQFFITLGEENAMSEGDKLHLTMKVKADVAQDGVATQSHKAPGEYIHWYCLDNINFTTEWTEFDKEVEVGTGGSWGKAEAGMYTIALNLSNGQHNTFYFDDIRVEIVKAPAEEPTTQE